MHVSRIGPCGCAAGLLVAVLAANGATAAPTGAASGSAAAVRPPAAVSSASPPRQAGARWGWRLLALGVGGGAGWGLIRLARGGAGPSRPGDEAGGQTSASTAQSKR